MQKAFPANINLLTLKQLDANNILVRLEHIYQKGEDTALSQRVLIDLNGTITNYIVTRIQELSLAGNEVLNQSGIKIYFCF